MSTSSIPTPARAPMGRIILAAAIDAALVITFAALGRRSHSEEATIAGLWQTAWPFLAALAVAWLVAFVWQRPTAALLSGLPVWIGTVAIGLLLRVLFTDGGAALPFVLVATSVLCLMLVGWRAVWALINKLRGGVVQGDLVRGKS